MAWVTRLPGGPDDLRFGYTLADVERLARSAAATTRAMAGDYYDRYAEAFGAVAEYLYTCEHPPPEHAMFQAGQNALFDQSRKDRSYRGSAYRHGEGWDASGTAPRFASYWLDVSRSAGSPEGLIVEREALRQILPLLSPGQRSALNALAITGDYEAAATLLGISVQTVRNQVGNARQRFLAWWHEGELPSSPWTITRASGDRSIRSFIHRRAETRRSAPKRAAEAATVRLTNAMKTHCPANHAYDEANTRFRANGNRVCRTCEARRKLSKRYGEVAVAHA